jgi:hypothetical protein
MEEDDYAISHTTPPEVKMIRDMVGCSYGTAWKAFYANKQDVVATLDALLVKPVVSGEKYIPPPPKVDTGMTTEQEERCKKGRWLQDQVNVVFSAAHSKTRTPRDAEDCSSGEAPPVATAKADAVAPTS